MALIHFKNTTDLEGDLTAGKWIREGFIGDLIAARLEYFTKVVILGGISLLGLLANIINVIVFIRQGFKDNINISLLGLSIADFGSLLGLVWMSICYNPLFINSGIPVDVKKVQYVTAGWPHVCFARITCYITAFITFERCLCIALPHKVKRIITPRRTVIAMVSIFIVTIAGVAPIYYATRFTFVFNEATNQSMLSFIYVESGRDIESGTLSFSTFLLISSVFIVGICTATLISNLSQKSLWRKSMASVDESFATRDKKVIKMVLSVAIIFSVCYLPTAISFTMMVCFPDYSIVGVQKNLFIVVFGFLFILEAVNSSVNIFIYYHMSSKFKAELQRLFQPMLFCRKRRLEDTADKDLTM